jgi:hypothetical protein
VGVNFNPFSNRSLSFKGYEKVGGALGELLETCFCVFPKKIDLGETSGELLEML